MNTTNSAVCITHIPTGITATIQGKQSQHKNKAKALKLITARYENGSAKTNKNKERMQEKVSWAAGIAVSVFVCLTTRKTESRTIGAKTPRIALENSSGKVDLSKRSLLQCGLCTGRS